MIDTHAHIHDPKFDEDRAEMLERARAAGVSDIISIGTDIADSARAIATANEYGTAVAVGIHPHEAEHAPANLDAAFEPLFAEAKRLVAIGEIGLDYYYDHSPREIQRTVLEAQLDIAARRDLPVIFHERDAFDDFVAVLRAERERRHAANLPALRGVIHCFTRDTAAARIYTGEFGLKLGIGGVLTFKTAQQLRDAVVAVGSEHLILETDCPYLAPVPNRGKRNEPAMMIHSAELLAQLFSTTPGSIAQQTDATAQSLFSL